MNGDAGHPERGVRDDPRDPERGVRDDPRDPERGARYAPRFPSVPLDRPHYESFYIKAAHPDGGLAVWIRHTVWKAPRKAPLPSLWLTVFERSTAPRALKATYSAERLRLAGDGSLEVGDARLGPGRAAGQLEAGGVSARWELEFDPGAPPFRYLPRSWMYTRPLPRTKPTLPFPHAYYSGRLEVAGQQIELERWPGMLGHNWGAEHPHRSVWIQATCFAEEPEAYLDAVVGRVKVGPVVAPWIGNGCLWLGGRLHRLGGLRPGATRIEASPGRAQFRLAGRDVVVDGEVGAPLEQFVGWRYGEPSGGWHPTLNCSLADMQLRIRDPAGAERTLSVQGGAAYELQLREHDHGVRLAPYPDP